MLFVCFLHFAQVVLYREDKKIRSLRDEQVATIPRLKNTNNINNKWPSLVAEP